LTCDYERSTTYVVQPNGLVDLGVGGDLALEVDIVPFRNVLGVQAGAKAQGNGGSIWKKQINSFLRFLIFTFKDVCKIFNIF